MAALFTGREGELEAELQSELQGAGTMSTVGTQECIASQSVIYAAPLRVIEDVEGLGAEFDQGPLCRPEVLEQSHVEIRAPWIAETVAS